MRIVITGAAGAIGRPMVDELAPAHELRLLDRRPIPDRRARVVDLGQPLPSGRWWTRLASPGADARWTAAFEGVDVVLHLAAQGNWAATWEDYAVSAQLTNPYDPADTRAMLGWAPEQRP